MTHHSHYHPSRTEQLALIRNETGESTEYLDLIDQPCEEEEENTFARLLGYHPEQEAEVYQ